MSEKRVVYVDVTDPKGVVDFVQKELVSIAIDDEVSPKERISALSNLGKNALTQSRLQQGSDSLRIQEEVARALLDVIDKQDPYANVQPVIGRAANLLVEIPMVKTLPGETATVQEEFSYHDIMGDED